MLHGLYRQRLPIWPVALALIGALAVRFDSVLLTIPVALAGFLLHAPFTAQEVILTRALGLGPTTTINPSGGPLSANPMMVAGLVRLGEAARRIHSGEAQRVLAHATSGPCLQQNLVAVLEAG